MSDSAGLPARAISTPVAPESEGHPGMQSGGSPQYAATVINGRFEILQDKEFFNKLRLLKSLQAMALYERINVPETHLYLGNLNLLREAPKRNSREDRPATLEEWSTLEKAIRLLAGHLTPKQLWQVQLSHISKFLIVFPFFLLLLAVSCLFLSIVAVGKQNLFIASYIPWVMATGGLGSVAFIYVNALSIQVDPTVNVLSESLVLMRILLGALFALMLALPFGLESFGALAKHLISLEQPVTIQQGSLLLLPFILGFSTPLVLSILNKIIVSIQGFFGVQDTGRSGSAPVVTAVTQPQMRGNGTPDASGSGRSTV
jgi:hypothetical protein